jgi:hypothetical protein
LKKDAAAFKEKTILGYINSDNPLGILPQGYPLFGFGGTLFQSQSLLPDPGRGDGISDDNSQGDQMADHRRQNQKDKNLAGYTFVFRRAGYEYNSAGLNRSGGATAVIFEKRESFQDVCFFHHSHRNPL